MTSNCPGSHQKIWQPLFAHLDVFAARWQTLAPPGCYLALLDMHLLQPLLEKAEDNAPLEQLLSRAEWTLFRQFRYPKRRQEWLGGRLTAKHCLHRLHEAKGTPPLSFAAYSLLPDALGRPSLEAPLKDGLAPSVSISHSRRYAAALACLDSSCGIDIQEVTPKLATVQERFMTEEELNLTDPSLAPLTRLGMIWTAKEAVKKCALADHSSYFGAIRIMEVRSLPEEALWTVRCQLPPPATASVMVRIGAMDNYLIACARGVYA